MHNAYVEDEDGAPGPQRKRTFEMMEREEGGAVTTSTSARGGGEDGTEEDDEEGRFFGGGLTDEQEKIFEILDRDGGEGEAPQIDLAAVRRMLLRLERAINKNQELRVKFPDDPTKFIDSEADLFSILKELSLLTVDPDAFYPEAIRLGAVASLTGLMSHENADIAIGVVEVIEELTDEDVVGGEVGEEVEEADERGRQGLGKLIEALLANALLDLLVANLARLSPDNEEDRQGIYHTLGVIENLLTHSPQPVSASLVSGSSATSSSTSLVSWLLDMIRRKEPAPGGGWDQNKGYASEVLSMLLQSSKEARDKALDADAMDAVLRVLSQFRRRTPTDAEELEFMENVFNALCSLLSEPKAKKLFLEGEGVELMVITMKEKHLARMRAIKVLDHALSGPQGGVNCERFVEAVGLKPFFSAFMGKGVKKGDTTYEDDEHMLGVLSSLLNNLASDSAPRLRVLAKFVEKEYEKVDRLLEIQEAVEARLKATEARIERERKQMEEEGEEIGEDEEDVFYAQRLESGLFSLQMTDYVMAWLCMEDDGILSHVKLLLSRRGRSLNDVIEVLKEYYDNIGDETVAVGAEGEGGAGAKGLQQKEIVVALVNYLLQVA